MAIKAELAIRHHGCATEHFTGGTSMAQMGGGRDGSLFVLHADTEDELEDALAACEAYASNEADIVDRSPTSVVFRGINPAGGIVAAIRESPCSLLWPIVNREGLEHYTVIARSAQELSELVERLGAIGNVSIERMVQVRPDTLDTTLSVAGLTTGLTRRQLDALLLAAEEGYYETPRGASIQELAATFGVGPSTFSEHLRKAESSLIGRVATLVAHHEVLARAAKKGLGRPPGSP